MVEQTKFTKLFMPGQPVRYTKLLYSNTLTQIREQLKDAIDEFHLFTDSTSNLIRKDDEGSIQLHSIVREPNNVHIMKLSIKVSINSTSTVEIPLTDSHTLTEARAELQKLKYERFQFIFGQSQIEESDESSTSIKDIQTEDGLIQIKLQDNEIQGGDINDPIREISEEAKISSLQDLAYLEQAEANVEQEELKEDSKNQSYEGMEELIDLYPDCALKCLLKLINSLNLKDKYEEESKNSNLNIPLDSSIQEDLTKLKDLLPLEYNLDEQVRKKFFDQIYELCISKNWKNAKKSSYLLLKEARVLDIQQLKLLLKKVDEAAGRIAGKDIILLLGETGSGKSTTTHFLAGSKMVQQKLKGINHIGPVEITNADAKNVISNPFSASVTKFLTPVTVKYGRNKEITLCDSPGFYDNQGSEVDIANGIGVIKAIIQAKSVRPVILLSARSTGDRFQRIKPIAKLLVGMIKNIEDYLCTLSYIFTKFSETEQNSLKHRIADVFDRLNEEEIADKAFISIFEDLKSQTEKDGHIFLDPLSNNHQEILTKLMKKDAITNPSNQFKFYITQDSEKAIRQQVNLHQIYIQKAVQQRDYQLLHHKLDELKFLMEELDKDDIRVVYNDCVSAIKQQLIEDFNKAKNIFNAQINGALIEKQIQTYVCQMNNCSVLQKLRSYHLGDDALTENAFVSNLDSVASQLAEICNKDDIDCTEVKEILDKLRKIFPYFISVQNFYLQCLDLKINDIEIHSIAYLDTLEQNEVQKGVDILKKIHTSTVNLKDHIEQGDINTIFSNLNSMFLQRMELLDKRIKEIFSKDDISSEDIKESSNILQSIKDYSEQYKSQKIIRPDEIAETYQTCLFLPENYFYRLYSSVQQIFEKKQLKCLNKIKPLILKMHQVRSNIAVLETTISQMFSQTLEQVYGKINDLERDIQRQIDISSENNQKKYEKLDKAIDYVQSATWVDTFKQGLIQKHMDQIIKMLKSRADYLYGRIEDAHIDLQNFKDLEIIINDTVEMNEMMTLSNIEEEFISEQSKNCYDLLKEKFQSIFTEIEQIGGYFSQIHPIVGNQDEELKVEDPVGDILQSSQINHVESALLFFNQFSGIKYQKIKGQFESLRQVVLEQSIFQQKLQKYAVNAKGNAEKLFDQIQNYNGDESQNLTQEVGKLEQWLQMFEEISKTQLFSKLFDPKQALLQKWSEQLDDYSFEMNDVISKLQLNLLSNEINNKLLIIKALIKVDQFNEGKHGYKFRDLYKTQNQKYIDRKPEAIKEVIDLIRTHQFSLVLIPLTNLETQKDNQSKQDLNNLENILRNTIEDLIEETRQSANSTQIRQNLTTENINKTLKNIKVIKSCKDLQRFVGDKIDFDHTVISLESIIIKNFCTQLDQIMNEIETFHFIDAYKNFDHIRSLQNVLQLNSVEIAEKLQRAEKSYQEVFKKIIEKFKCLEFNRLSLNKPRDIFFELRGVEHIPECKETIEKFQEVIQNKFREELDTVKDIEGLQMKLDKIERIKSYLQYLPEELSPIIAEEILHTQRKIEYEAQNLSLNQSFQMPLDESN